MFVCVYVCLSIYTQETAHALGERTFFHDALEKM